MNEREMVEKNLILKIRTGSHLYGTNTEFSDEDYLGVFIPSKDYVLGLKVCEQIDIKTNPSDSGRRNNKDDSDTTFYSLPKYIKLCAGNNPNLVETLFVDRKNIIYINDFGEKLLSSYAMFISKKVKHKFLGYAISQRQNLLFKNPIGNRVEFIEKFGFDVKFGSHLIRLLTEGIDLLRYGRLSYPITHSDLVRDIKLGKLSLSDVLNQADQLGSLIEDAYLKSSLQDSPNYESINALQIQLLENWWNLNTNNCRCQHCDPVLNLEQFYPIDKND